MRLKNMTPTDTTEGKEQPPYEPFWDDPNYGSKQAQERDELNLELIRTRLERGQLRKQRDELLAACKAMALVGTWGKSSPILAQANAAIAKAESPERSRGAEGRAQCVHNDREWRSGNWMCVKCGDVVRQ